MRFQTTEIQNNFFRTNSPIARQLSFKYARFTSFNENKNSSKHKGQFLEYRTSILEHFDEFCLPICENGHNKLELN